MNFFDYIYLFFGLIIQGIYYIVKNYGLAIIVFTIFTKLLLWPLTLKQQKGMVKMQALQPKLTELQEKYKDDKEKQNQEMMKLYQKYKINPMASCLPLLIQFPLIYFLYKVIREPMRFILNMPIDQINAMKNQYIEATGAMPPAGSEQIFLANHYGLLDFNFLGLNLSQTPQITQISWYWIIPIIAAGTTFLASKMMNIGMEKKPEPEVKKIENRPARPPRPGEKKAGGGETANQMTKTMTYFMPLMTLFFTFSLPNGISVYWIAGNVVQLVQQFVMNKFLVPKMKERAEIENDLKNENKYRKKRKKR